MNMTTPIAATAAKLENLLKLRSIPFGMKLFENSADMEAIPKKVQEAVIQPSVGRGKPPLLIERFQQRPQAVIPIEVGPGVAPPIVLAGQTAVRR